ncbi:hypothetical protein LTR37_002306 [Vermiconidia calcicola]|uniref:Uncharacterized protein n=1 Tax=Vermiconidia calcicola TaxID=1690605 RepID=A0ACC3NTF9_9PEZI|nr:hypothetical protein LTR37_002306 [Vermiconidia calcicola]
MADDIIMDDMDIDLTEDDDPEIIRLKAAAEAMDRGRAAEDVAEGMNGVEEAPEEGEVDTSAPAPTKVHIRGLHDPSTDTFLTTHDIKAFAADFYSMDLFTRVEWIDDNSANIIYDTEDAASEALEALSADPASAPSQLRQARTYTKHPDIRLEVRQAIVADVKAPHAKDESRFYLLNPTWDPEERKRKRRPDNGYHANKYRRRDYEEDDLHRPGYYGDEIEHRRGSREKVFHEDMYGDDPQVASDSRRNSISSGSELGRRKVHYGDDGEDLVVRRPNGRLRDNGDDLIMGRPNGRLRDNGDDLIVGRPNGRLRDRSASPGRAGDGRYGFREDQPRRPTARPRSRTPSRVRASRDNYGARDNKRKELFVDRQAPSALTNGHGNGTSRELFSNRPSASSSGRELFPDKLNGTAHRRHEAKVLHPDEVADAIGRYSIDGSTKHLTYRASGRQPASSESNGRGRGADLFSRIDLPRMSSTTALLHDRPPVPPPVDTGFSIRGAGRANEGPGFSILGASRERTESALARELFPRKANGVSAGGLSDGRLNGRGPQRRRAEDLF